MTIAPSKLGFNFHCYPYESLVPSKLGFNSHCYPYESLALSKLGFNFHWYPYESLAPSKLGFNFHWYPYESLVVAGRTSGQNGSRVPVEILHCTSVPVVGMSDQFSHVSLQRRVSVYVDFPKGQNTVSALYTLSFSPF